MICQKQIPQKLNNLERLTNSLADPAQGEETL